MKTAVPPESTPALRDLVGAMRFIEGVTVRLQGVRSEPEVYQTVCGEFDKTRRYSTVLLKLSEAGDSLSVVGASVPRTRLRDTERVGKFKLASLSVRLKESALMRRVVQDGETVQFRIQDLLNELFPQVVARLVAKVPRLQNRFLIATPFRKAGEIVGVFSMSCPALAGTFTPSVENLAHQISSALDLAEENRIRKEAQEAIRREKSFTRHLVESSVDGILAFDPDCRYTVWNKGMERISGMPREKVLGRVAFEVFPFLKQSGEDRCFYDALAGKTVVAKDRQFTIPESGKQGFFEGYYSPIRDETGGIVGGLGIIRDVTERKDAERDLRSANEKLRRMIEQANNANEAKTRFLATMSHEIRTPLNGIIGMVQLLLESELNVGQKEYAETAQGSARCLLGIVDDILDFSKIEAGRLNLEHAPFDVRQVVQDVADLLGKRAQDKGIDLTTMTRGSVPGTVAGDATRLRQVLINLAENAVKFTDHGSVSIEVMHEAVVDGKVRLMFEVRDTGIGIPEKETGTLFHPFSQVDSSSTRKYGGTGLGLAISKRIVEAMGGEIEVESEENAGSCFRFTVAFAATESDRTQVVLPKTVAPVMPRMRILLAEDNEVSQRVAQHMLKKLGHRVDVTNNGFELLEALRRGRYDLVFLDVQMPGMDGLEAARIVRGEQSDVIDHNVPIVAMTAFAADTDRRNCLNAGMNDYVSKPVTLEKLAQVIVRTGTSGDGRHGNTRLHGFTGSGLLSRLDGDRELAGQVVSTFLQTAPAQLKAMRCALDSGDVATGARAAHKMKGACLTIEARGMADNARLVERACLEGDNTLAMREFAALQKSLSELRETVDDWNREPWSQGARA